MSNNDLFDDDPFSDDAGLGASPDDPFGTSDLFGEGFTDEDLDASLGYQGLDIDRLEVEEDTGQVNRTFLYAGLAIMLTFVAVVVGIILLASGGDDNDAEATANAIETANAQDIANAEASSTALAEQDATRVAAEITGTAEARSSAEAAFAETETAAIDLLRASETQRALNATNTQVAIDGTATAVALETMLALTPSPVPTRVLSVGITNAQGTPVTSGSFALYIDDGDRAFNPNVTPTPIATATPTLTPSSQASPTLRSSPTFQPTAVTTEIGTPEVDEGTVTATMEPGEDVEPAEPVDPTAAARTAEAGISAFDATATARARPAEDEATEEAADDTAEGPEEPTAAPDEAPVELPQTAIGGENAVSVQLPAEWVFSDQLQSLGAVFFGDSQEAIDTRATLAPVVEGLGGQVLPQPAGAFGPDEDVDELLTTLATETGESIVEPPADIPFEDDTITGRYVVIAFENEQGIFAYLTFPDGIGLVRVTATTETFEANRDLLLTIVQSVRIPATTDEAAAYPDRNDTIILAGFGHSRNSPVSQDGPEATPSESPPPEGEDTPPAETPTEEPASADEGETGDSPETDGEGDAQAQPPTTTPAPDDADEYVGSFEITDGQLQINIPG
ncbi:MAG: hypothetical protein GYB66_11635, partial [Chloroflexi bacterium]|nr:hypothetical protein [Chloroflexota bacterium]